MGFYFRKSFTFGGLRVNFSKSGVGFSTGVKGFRLGTGPRGNYIHVGSNGFYYKKTFRTKKEMNVSNHTDEIKEPITYNFQDIETKDVSLLTDSTAEDLLNEIIEKNSKLRLWILWTMFSILISFFNPVLFVIILLTPFLFYIDKRRKTVVLAYDIDQEQEARLQRFYNSFDDIINSRRKWHIPSKANLNTTYERKVNAGAWSVVNRKDIGVSFSAPPYFKTNVKIPKIPVGRQTLYFFPDRVLVFEKNRVGCVNYKDLEINNWNVRFIENEFVPSDTRIVDRTWKYVNKNGGPDRRYSNNKQLPIVEYSQLNFSSESGLNEVIQISKPDIGNNLIKSLNIVQ